MRETWTGCYDDGWRDLIVPDAFAHPAKAARGLLRRIFAYESKHPENAIDWEDVCFLRKAL